MKKQRKIYEEEINYENIPTQKNEKNKEKNQKKLFEEIKSEYNDKLKEDLDKRREKA